MIRTRSYITLCLCLSSFKLLFLKSYVSTDFDVHRNWMAITYNLNLRDWYFDTTSEWTLDYPPLFAIFELLLASIAHALQLHDALKLDRNPIRSESVIVYQKVTVIAGDIVYYFAVYKLCKSLQTLFVGPAHQHRLDPHRQPHGKTKGTCNTDTSNSSLESTSKSSNSDEDVSKSSLLSSRSKKIPVKVPVKSNQTKTSHDMNQSLLDSVYRPDATSCMSLLLLLQPGLLLVDHIHFQYNGLLSGILLLSAANIIQAKYISASFWFAVLFNMKHIYLYCAPAYGMYLVSSYCLARQRLQNRLWTFIVRAGRLGSVVLLVVTITYAPFSDRQTLSQILSRLFPFKRGLTHAYWAPNAWSIYNFLDKILATVFRDSLKVTFDLESITKTRTMIKSTSGKVGEFEHQYLPVIKPLTTFILVGVFMVPIVTKFLVRLDRRSPRLFMKGLTLTAFISFMFGWHVHEKAIILVLLPMVPICFTDPHLRPAFLRLTLAGTYSLFPLIHQPAEYPVKLTLLVAYYYYARSQQPELRSERDKNNSNQKLVEHQQPESLSRQVYLKFYQLMDVLYILVIILNEMYFFFVFGRLDYGWNPLAKLNRLAFLPLMMTSTLSALGISVSFLELYYDFVACPDELVAAAAATF